MSYVLGIDSDGIDMWYPSNLSHKSYVACISESIVHLWEPPTAQWADTVSHSEPMRCVRERSIEIYTHLKDAPRGPRRSELIEEAYQLSHGMAGAF